jgi:transposase InsO family protein
VNTIKREYVAHMPKQGRETALRNLAIAFEHYNEQHPRGAMNYRCKEVQALDSSMNSTGRWCPVEQGQVQPPRRSNHVSHIELTTRKLIHSARICLKSEK